MLADLQSSLRAELADLAARNRLRVLIPLAGPSRTLIALAETPLVSFCSNDYLGLAADPRLAAAAVDATSAEGFGAAASRLVSGDLPPHRLLEGALAHHFGHPAALLFPSGYQANLGVLSALAGPDDLIVSDALNHASLIDGCRLSRAAVQIYPHADAGAAHAFLSSPDATKRRRRFLLTESVFSMDGDIAPLAELAAVARATGSALILDEAHAIGVLGPRGRGLAAEAGITPDALMGTLGKAFGSAGGFVAGVAELRDILINRARTFVFTTAAPPSLPAAANAALAIIDSAEGDTLRHTLANNVLQLRAGLAPHLGANAPSFPTPIVPLILGPDSRALSASRALRADGYFVQAIRPPTVPEGTARLRITLSAAHTPQQIDGLIAACRRALA